MGMVVENLNFLININAYGDRHAQGQRGILLGDDSCIRKRLVWEFAAFFFLPQS